MLNAHFSSISTISRRYSYNSFMKKTTSVV